MPHLLFHFCKCFIQIGAMVDLDPRNTGCEAGKHPGQDGRATQHHTHLWSVRCSLAQPSHLLVRFFENSRRKLREPRGKHFQKYSIIWLTEWFLVLGEFQTSCMKLMCLFYFVYFHVISRNAQGLKSVITRGWKVLTCTPENVIFQRYRLDRFKLIRTAP